MNKILIGCLIVLGILLVGCQEVYLNEELKVADDKGEFLFELELAEEDKKLYYDLQLKFTLVASNVTSNLNITHERTTAQLITPSGNVTEIDDMTRVDREDRYLRTDKIIVFRKLNPEPGLYNLSLSKEEGKFSIESAEIRLMKYVFSEDS